MTAARRIRTLQRIVAEREPREDAAAAHAAARQVLSFYEREAARGDSLGGEYKPPDRGRPRRPKYRRQRPRKAFAKEYALAVLREADGPMTARENRDRVAKEYRPLTRQAVSNALLKLHFRGEVEKVVGSCAVLWAAKS